MDCAAMITSEEYLDVIVDTGYFDISEIPDGCVVDVDKRIKNIYFLRRDVPELAIDFYGYESLPKCYTIMDEVENVNESIAATVSNRQGLTGSGIIMGFIDTGIDIRSNSFRNSDGTTRIKHIWDQTISGKPPEGFLYGSEYNESDINEALRLGEEQQVVPSVDENGHGTYIASIAAGSESITGEFKGIATACDIAVVKLKMAKKYLRDFFLIKDALAEQLPVFQENDIMLGLKYLSEIAKREDKVLVVCLALGTNIGQYGSMPFLSTYINTLSLGRNYIIIGTGNEANKRHHFSGKVNGIEPVEMEIRTSGNSVGFWMEIWGDAPDIFSIGITSPGGDNIERIDFNLGETAEYDFVFEKTKVTVDYLLYGKREWAPLIIVRMQSPSDGVWKIRLYGERIIYGNVNAFLPLSNFTEGETYFLQSDPNSTLISPSGAINAIATGAYDMRNNSIYYASGRGYPAQGNVKPDVASFGVRVLGAGNRGDGSYVAYSGTGIASAVLSGAIALFLQWAVVEGNVPNVGNVIVKNFLQQSAMRSDNRNYPNREWGYGALDLEEMFSLFRYS